MRIFKHLNGVFYYTQERNTLRWYSEGKWRKEIVREPAGTMLVEGVSEKAIEEVGQTLPPDLHKIISRFYLETV